MIAVLGSANVDMVTEVPRIPRPGETVLARAFEQYSGGKGANQAVAAARLGEHVAFFGNVGRDSFGDEILSRLRTDGIDVSGVEQVEGTSTGLASIWVDAQGENAIAYTPGANAAVDAAYVDRVFDRIVSADVILLQFEIPMDAIAYLLRKLPSDRPTVIIDPAPAQDISCLPLHRIDVLTPNETELFALTHERDIPAAARRLLDRGVRAVVCKAGGQGAFWVSTVSLHVAAPVVHPVDTTAAGDAFNGALAGVIGTHKTEQALQWANAVGALTTTRRGAQPSLPTRQAVCAFLKEQVGATGSTGDG
jgi:ribokinase